MISIFTKQIVSSTYRFQNVLNLVKLGRSEFSSSIIKMCVKTGSRGKLMATPSVSTYVLNSKVKRKFFVHSISISFISFFVIDVTIPLFSYILYEIISIVPSNGTFVNKDLTTNDTILCYSNNFCCFNSLMNSLVFFTVFLDCRKGENNLERYFAKFYFVVFRFKNISRISRSFTESLCILAVP